MNFKIHQSTQGIGCAGVEVWTRKTRILIDVGLPGVEGLYKNVSHLLNGVLISQSHLESYSFVNYLQHELKFFLGEASYNSANRGNFSSGKEEVFKNHTFLERYTPFVIGDLKISPYRMDHATFETYAFLVEGERASIFYSGDIQGIDRKSETYQRFIRYAPKNIDYLLLQDNANTSTLTELVSAIQPKKIVPLQRSKGAEYKKLFNYPVQELREGEEVSC